MLYKCFGNISITNIVPCINFTARCEDICVVLMLNCYRVLIYWVQLSPICHCSALFCLDLCIHTVPNSASQPFLALCLWQPTPWESIAVHMVTVLLQEIKHITISQVNLINCHHTDENYLKWWQIAFHCMPETKASVAKIWNTDPYYSMCSTRKINANK